MSTTSETKPRLGLEANALYWGETGAIACGRHTPYPGSDTWSWERWQAVTPEERHAFEAEVGHPMTCETCDAQRRNNNPEENPEK